MLALHTPAECSRLPRAWYTAGCSQGATSSTITAGWGQWMK
jgi:hypothetical protein